jgi:hypothetical protein
MVAAGAALLMAACTSSQGSSTDTTPQTTATGSQIERDRPASMSSSRTYSGDELAETGEADLGRALNRADPSPR